MQWPSRQASSKMRAQRSRHSLQPQHPRRPRCRHLCRHPRHTHVHYWLQCNQPRRRKFAYKQQAIAISTCTIPRWSANRTVNLQRGTQATLTAGTCRVTCDAGADCTKQDVFCPYVSFAFALKDPTAHDQVLRLLPPSRALAYRYSAVHHKTAPHQHGATQLIELTLLPGDAVTALQRGQLHFARTCAVR
jgi:hypothetical protein